MAAKLPKPCSVPHLVAAKPENVERRMALGYALSRAGQPYDSLFEFDQAFIAPVTSPSGARIPDALQTCTYAEPACA